MKLRRPNGDNILVTVKRITDERGVDMESAPHPKQQHIDLGVKLEQYDVLRRKRRLERKAIQKALRHIKIYKCVSGVPSFGKVLKSHYQQKKKRGNS